MSNKRAIRTDTLNHRAFVKIEDEELNKVLHPHNYYNDSRHTMMKVLEGNSYQARQIIIEVNSIKDSLQNFSNRFCLLSNTYTTMQNYPNFTMSQVNSLQNWVWEEYIYSQVKDGSMVSLFKDLLQITKDFEATRYDKNFPGDMNSWDIQRTLQEPLNEKYNDITDEINKEWATIRDNVKGSIGLGGLVKNCLLFSQPDIHYNLFYGEETDENLIETMKNYFSINFEAKEMTADKQTEYITYVADYEPILFIRMAQWMQFFADNPSIELVAHTTTSAYKSHDAFYRCNRNEVANANGNKAFFMPLELGIEAPTIDEAIHNFSLVIDEWETIGFIALKATQEFNNTWEINAEKTNESLKTALNGFLKEQYANTGAKDCVLNLIATQHGFSMGGSISFLQETIQYHDFNRGTDASYYISHIGTLGDGILDITAIGLTEADTNELSRMWNKKQAEVLRSHQYGQQRLVEQMTSHQNEFNKKKESTRNRFMELLQR
jgi:hypothetical protein